MKYRKLNASECPKCHVTVISRSVHDFKVCGCSNETMVDGGFDYARFGGVVRPLRPELYEKIK